MVVAEEIVMVMEETKMEVGEEKNEKMVVEKV